MIDVERLRKDLQDECLSAFFGGGFSSALLETIDFETASEEELLECAKEYMFDLDEYEY